MKQKDDDHMKETRNHRMMIKKNAWQQEDDDHVKETRKQRMTITRRMPGNMRMTKETRNQEDDFKKKDDWEQKNDDHKKDNLE